LLTLLLLIAVPLSAQQYDEADPFHVSEQVDELARYGWDLSKPLELKFGFIFSDRRELRESSARSFAARMKQLGYATEVHGPSKRDEWWFVDASKTVTPDRKALIDLSKKLDQIAADYYGRYFHFESQPEREAAQRYQESLAARAPEIERRAREAAQSLRRKALSATPESFGIDRASHPGNVWGMAMDVGRSGETATLICFGNGTAHLYIPPRVPAVFGKESPSVSEACTSFLELGNKRFAAAAVPAEFALPTDGQVALHFLSYQGARSFVARQSDLAEGSELTDLFRAGSNVLRKMLGEMGVEPGR
jgi:hypothetical protein